MGSSVIDVKDFPKLKEEEENNHSNRKMRSFFFLLSVEDYSLTGKTGPHSEKCFKLIFALFFFFFFK